MGRCRDLLFWIPSRSYPSKEIFLDEAERLGVSCRVPHVPDLRLCRSLLFLSDSKGVFGCCVVECVEMVFDCKSAMSEYRERKKLFGSGEKIELTHVVGGWEIEERRRSGYRSIGSLYVSSYDRDPEIQKIVDFTGAEKVGPVAVFSSSVEINRKKSVSYSYISRGRILSKARKKNGSGRG